MATVFYDKAAVSVDFAGVGETLLASDFTVNYSASVQPLYAIGGKGSLGQFPAAARVGDASFNFITTITGTPHGCRGNIINYLFSSSYDFAFGSDRHPSYDCYWHSRCDF